MSIRSSGDGESYSKKMMMGMVPPPSPHIHDREVQLQKITLDPTVRLDLWLDCFSDYFSDSISECISRSL
ncbi:hypothetical protein L1887_12433 [Cichorium endivia]|nr:hypothetical protein L1887_12433 [Cichorium endivia]